VSWDDNITIILDRHEAVALSAAILTLGESGHRGEQIEAVRRKLRAGLNHRARDQDEHDAEAAIIAHEYVDVCGQCGGTGKHGVAIMNNKIRHPACCDACDGTGKRLVSPEDYAYSHCQGCGQEYSACECEAWRLWRGQFSV
jgi:hypothetical protein